MASANFNERFMTYYTPDEFSKLIKCHRTTVYRLIKQKKLEAIRIGGVVRIPESVLVASNPEPKGDAITKPIKKEKLWE